MIVKVYNSLKRGSYEKNNSRYSYYDYCNVSGKSSSFNGASIMKKVFNFIGCIALVILIFGLGAVYGPSLYKKLTSKEPTVTSEIVSAKLSAASELTSGKIKMQGFIHFDNQGIPVLTKGTFILEYEAEIRAGIDISKVVINSVDNENKIINITVPKAEILDVNVDPDSLQTNNTSFTLFNLKEKEDLINAQQEAKEHALEYAESSGLLELADQQSATLIKGILATGFPEYTINITVE